MYTYALIPAYNESKTIYTVVSEVKKYVDEVVVVDDGSTDQTSSEATRGGAFVLRHALNRGQGAALQTGFDFVKETVKRSNLDALRSPDISVGTKEGGSTSENNFVVVTFDADGQFEASEIPKLIEPIKSEEADVVLGSRFLNSKIPPFKKLLLKLAVYFTNMTTGLNLTDTHNGFRALNAKAVNLIKITQDRMAHGSEILSELVKYNLKYQEAPVTIKYSSYSLSKGQKLGDYFKILFDLFIRKIIQ